MVSNGAEPGCELANELWPGRVPVLGQHNMGEARDEPVDDGHHGIALGDRERAARAEIVLHIDDQQHIVVADLHVAPAMELKRRNPSSK